jgi:hypothetical protein
MNADQARSKLEKLKALRGGHDQTVRTQTIKLIYGPSTDVTETARFLEAEIARLEQVITIYFNARE